MKKYTKLQSNGDRTGVEPPERSSHSSQSDNFPASETISTLRVSSGYCNSCIPDASATQIETAIAQTTTNSSSVSGLHANCCRDLVSIEQRLYRHPSIASATAFCYVDKQTETKFGAAIQLQDWVQRVVASEIRQWLSRHLKPELIPERIIWIDPVPTTIDE